MTPTTRSPAPAANSSSVACGARLTIRCAGAASVTVTPASSVACTAACAMPAPAATTKRSQPARVVAATHHRITAPNAGEHRRAAGRVAGGELVVLVEHVVGAREQRDVAPDVPFGGEVDDAVAAHLHEIRRVVVAQRRGDVLEAEAHAARPDSPPAPRRAGARGAAAGCRCGRWSATAGRATPRSWRRSRSGHRSPSVTPSSVARSTLTGAQLKSTSHWNTISWSTWL